MTFSPSTIHKVTGKTFLSFSSQFPSCFNNIIHENEKQIKRKIEVYSSFKIPQSHIM